MLSMILAKESKMRNMNTVPSYLRRDFNFLLTSPYRFRIVGFLDRKAVCVFFLTALRTFDRRIQLRIEGLSDFAVSLGGSISEIGVGMRCVTLAEGASSRTAPS